MTQKDIILTFSLAMVAYVLTVFLWPLGTDAVEKTARLAGPPTETAFLKERFGVPAGDPSVPRLE